MAGVAKFEILARQTRGVQGGFRFSRLLCSPSSA